jgi:hypothetical protein
MRFFLFHNTDVIITGKVFFGNVITTCFCRREKQALISEIEGRSLEERFWQGLKKKTKKTKRFCLFVFKKEKILLI